MGFDEAALNYFYSSDHKKGDDLEFCRNYFKGYHFNKFLDVASAAGHFAKIFKADVKVICDLSLNMLKVAREKNNFDKLVLCNASSLPFKNKVFDIVGCRIAFHHFKDSIMFFSEIKRVLKNHGFFVLIDSIVDIEDEALNKIEIIRDKTHIRSYTIKEILTLSSGFRLLSFHTIFKKHNFEEWAKRLSPSKSHFDMIEKAFLRLPEHIKEHLKVEIRNSRVVSYTDKKGIFIFQKEDYL
ncbi:class I SAM-dependent methyltransferase [Hippea maritima]|uniref:Methyltransferase type 11 n=1 Tax=Hippea maritima (strain ATCC 700847 / DSM 10411 / MH2) TaxID=760142 RepID=F2LVH1_HIPMA|nr:class I SAM-dependent methyltransferase [Hippea maritima]AEA33755.1 Methyltransferase type 11 [Hippea maritima DSM 10411]